MSEVSQANVPAAGWRLKLGGFLFGLSMVLPVLGILLVAAMGLSAATVATVSGVLLGGSVVLGIVAVADMVPGYAGNEFTYAVVGDVLLLTSLFVLGGDFWDKLRALFIHGARAVFPQAAG